jgi:hypothetical protein
MAIVKRLTHQPLERDSKHTVVECTYSIVLESDGSKSLQLDTYGSNQRQIKGKKSQSLPTSGSCTKCRGYLRYSASAERQWPLRSRQASLESCSFLGD